MENIASDPIEYPTVLIDGKPVEVKFRCGDIIRLKRDHGIDIAEVKELKGADALEHTLKMLSAGISHKVQKSSDELMDLVDLADFMKIADAVTGAIKKAFPQAKTTEAKPNGAIQ